MNRPYLRFIKATAIALLFVVTGQALALPTGSIGYSQLSYPNNTDLGAVYVSAGYEFELGSNTSLTPELRLGTGVKDDNDCCIPFGSLKLHMLYGLAGRANYNLDNGVYFFGTASYVNYDIEATGPFFGRSTNWEFGIGAGLGLYFTNHLGIELQYENVDSEDVFSAGLRFRF